MDIFEIIKIIIISLIEGVTEWLPVSSTGHMILFNDLVQLKFSPEFKSLFLVVIQLGAILAVVYLYFAKLNPFSRRKTRLEQQKTLDLWKKVAVACVPAGVIGFLWDDFIDQHLLNPQIVAAALIIYGVIFIVVEKFLAKNRQDSRVKKVEDLTYSDAVKIGGFQVLSLVPGTSRSGATIIGGLLGGASREVAAEFSFFLAIPIMFGASLLKLLKFGLNFSPAEAVYLGLTMILTFLFSILAIKTFVNYIKKHNFEVFGWYRISLGVLVILYFIFK